MTSLSTTASQRQRHEKVASTSDRSELSIHSLLGNETLSAAVATTDNGEFRFTVAPMAQGQLASNVLDSGSQRLFATAPYGPGDFLGSVSHGQSASTLLSGTTPLDNGPSFYQNNHLINNTTNAVPASFADHRLRVIPPEQRVSLSVRSSHSVNELERQKTLNTLLQEQIQDNIRRQEDLVRRLMANEPDSVGAIPERQPGSGPYSVSNSNEQNATMLAVMHRNSVSSVNDTSSISDANRHVAMSNHPAVMNAPGIITSNQPQLSNDLSSCLLASKGPISSNMLQNRQLPGQLPIDAPQYGNAFAGFGQQRLLHPNYVQIQPPTFPTINNSMNGIDDSNTMIGNSTSGPQYHMNHQQLPNMGFVTNANVWNVDEIQRQGFSGLKPSSDT